MLLCCLFLFLSLLSVTSAAGNILDNFLSIFTPKPTPKPLTELEEGWFGGDPPEQGTWSAKNIQETPFTQKPQTKPPPVTTTDAPVTKTDPPETKNVPPVTKSVPAETKSDPTDTGSKKPAVSKPAEEKTSSTAPKEKKPSSQPQITEEPKPPPKPKDQQQAASKPEITPAAQQPQPSAPPPKPVASDLVPIAGEVFPQPVAITTTPAPVSSVLQPPPLEEESDSKIGLLVGAGVGCLALLLMAGAVFRWKTARDHRRRLENISTAQKATSSRFLNKARAPPTRPIPNIREQSSVQPMYFPHTTLNRIPVRSQGPVIGSHSHSGMLENISRPEHAAPQLPYLRARDDPQLHHQDGRYTFISNEEVGLDTDPSMASRSFVLGNEGWGDSSNIGDTSSVGLDYGRFSVATTTYELTPPRLRLTNPTDADPIDAHPRISEDSHRTATTTRPRSCTMTTSRGGSPVSFSPPRLTAAAAPPSPRLGIHRPAESFDPHQSQSSQQSSPNPISSPYPDSFTPRTPLSPSQQQLYYPSYASPYYGPPPPAHMQAKHLYPPYPSQPSDRYYPNAIPSGAVDPYASSRTTAGGGPMHNIPPGRPAGPVSAGIVSNTGFQRRTLYAPSSRNRSPSTPRW